MNTEKKAVIYCRVSTTNQVDNNSIDIQKNSLLQFAAKNNIVVDDVDIEISTSYRIVPPKLQKLIQNTKNKHILVYSIDRFNRNVVNGTKLLKKCIENNCILVFWKEQLIITKDSYDDLIGKFNSGILNAQRESELLGERIKKSKKRNREMGIYMGGKLPIGTEKVICYDGPKIKYRVQIKEHFRRVYEFIKACRSGDTSVLDLNLLIERCGGNIGDLSDEKNEDLIVIWEGLNKRDKLNGPLSKVNIVSLLNEYSIESPNESEWTISLLNSVYNNFTKYNKVVEIEQVNPNYLESREYSEKEVDEMLNMPTEFDAFTEERRSQNISNDDIDVNYENELEEEMKGVNIKK